MEEFVNNKLGDLKISKGLQKLDNSDLLCSYDFKSLYPSAPADKNSTWPAIEMAYLFE